MKTYNNTAVSELIQKKITELMNTQKVQPNTPYYADDVKFTEIVDYLMYSKWIVGLKYLCNNYDNIQSKKPSNKFIRMLPLPSALLNSDSKFRLTEEWSKMIEVYSKWMIGNYSPLLTPD